MEHQTKTFENNKIQQTLIEIADDYEHPEQGLEYVLENILQEKSSDEGTDEEYLNLCDRYNSILTYICNCSGEDNCSFNSKCVHGSNYTKANSSNELVLDKEKRTRYRNSGDIIYECSNLCKCDVKKCRNRLVQYGPRKHLQIIDSLQYKSKGVSTNVNIPNGGFICEYAGELLTMQEAQNRSAENEKNFKMNYILCLYELSQNCEGRNDGTKIFKTVVDPSRKGNVGRYLNHSCEPNCEIFSVRVDCPIPKIAIYAKRDIVAGEELCFHYGGEESKVTKNVTFATTPCLCNSKNCNKFMPFTEFLKVN